MTHRYFLATIAILVVIGMTAVTTVAQVAELRGSVFMQQADGTKVPLADAVIDVYRTDIKGEYHTKTNKKGEFVFAGLPFVGEYTIVASHPTASPNFLAGFKVGRQITADIIVTPGNGKKLTLEETRNAALSGRSAAKGGGNESAEDRAKREELARKNKEIEESNKKVTEANEIISRTFKAGNEALAAGSVASKAKNSAEAIQKYTEAVTQFDQGLAADAEQPALLTNKSVALKNRAIERFNSSITSQMDDATKTSTMDSARADFRAAAEAAGKAVALLKAQTPPTDPTELDRFNKNKYAAMVTHADAMRLFVTKADGTKADEGIAAYKDYIAVETDPVKKKQAQLDAAQMLLDAGAADKAFQEFQTIVTEQPDNPDANLGAGLALFASGDKTKFQDAANYLQHYVDVAPDDHKYKADAKAILTELKNTEKVVPEKTPPARRRRP